MSGWRDCGYDHWNMHCYERVEGHIRYIVCSGWLGTYAAIIYRGGLRMPSGYSDKSPVETLMAFLDEVHEAVMAMSVEDRHAYLMNPRRYIVGPLARLAS